MKRATANMLRSVFDECLPPALRETAPFRWLTRIWLGRNCLVDFKQRAFSMSDRQFIDAYRALGGIYAGRDSDTTEHQISWLLAQTDPNSLVLEIGPGNKELTGRLVPSGTRVITLDLTDTGSRAGDAAVVGTAERLPLADKSVDVTIAAHVIEHVRSLTRTFLELERVTRKTVLIVVPRQRWYMITFDYHLHFFYGLPHLASYAHRGSAQGKVIDRDLCLRWDVV